MVVIQEKGKKFMLMERIMKENGKMTYIMVKESCSQRMEKNMKVILLMEISMVKVNLYMKMVMSILVHSKIIF